jgi:hypothetical protein
MLDALRAIRTEPGRLAVVEVGSAEFPGDVLGYREHHILIPQIDAADTRGRLEPLSAERRALLDRRIEEYQHRRRVPGWLAKLLFDHHTPDALYLDVDMLELGGAFQLRNRSAALPKHKWLLDAADCEAHPGRLLCIVHPDWIGQNEAATWIDLEQLGLFLEADPCRENERLLAMLTQQPV